MYKSILLLLVFANTMILNSASIEIIFDQQFDGSGYEDMGIKTVPSANGGFLAGGNKFIGGYNTPQVMVIKKINEDGSEEWNKDIYKGWEYIGDHLTDILEVKNGEGESDGIVICGNYCESNDFPNFKGSFIKLDDEGNELFFTSLPYQNIPNTSGVTQVKPQVILQTADNGFLVGGFISRNSQKDFYLVKFDSAGTVLWQKSYDDSSEDVITDLLAVDDNSGNFDYFLALGYLKNDEDGNDLKVMKLNADGDRIENITIQGDSNSQVSTTIDKTSFESEGFILSSYTKITSNYKSRIVKLNSSLEIVWDNYFGTDDANEIIKGVVEDGEGNYIACGHTTAYGAQESDMLVLKIDNEGNEIYHTIYGGTANDYISSFSKTETDYNYIATGWTFSNITGGYEDMWLVDFQDDTASKIENYENLLTDNHNLKQNYPNPFNPVTQINYELANIDYKSASIVVYNAKGESVWSSKPLSLNTNHCTFDGSKFNSGIYHYSLIVDGKKIAVKSMVLIK